MRDKSNTCCFTGHRDISMVSFSDLMARTEKLVLNLVNNGYKYFACGGAIGFDTFAATYIMSLKKRGFDVKLLLILPCTDQAKRWSEYNQKVYNFILDAADEVVYTSEYYYNGCMQKRNRALVDSSSACICFLLEQGGSGTRQTVEYAHTRGIPVANVAEG